LFRPVSWLADHYPLSPSQAFFEKSVSKKAQWPTEKGLTAYSCGRSFGLACRKRRANITEFPLPADQNRHPERRALETSAGSLSRHDRPAAAKQPNLNN
jgi:hypothetical protein